jgi:hypothetical protein
MRPPADAKGLAGGREQGAASQECALRLRHAPRAWNKRLEGDSRGRSAGCVMRLVPGSA